MLFPSKRPPRGALWALPLCCALLCPPARAQDPARRPDAGDTAALQPQAQATADEPLAPEALAEALRTALKAYLKTYDPDERDRLRARVLELSEDGMKRNLGTAFHNRGVLFNHEGNAGEAFGLFQEAAARGVPEAYFALGQYYERGEVVDADADQALIWYDKASAAGNAAAAELAFKLIDRILSERRMPAARNEYFDRLLNDFARRHGDEMPRKLHDALPAMKALLRESRIVAANGAAGNPRLEGRFTGRFCVADGPDPVRQEPYDAAPAAGSEWRIFTIAPGQTELEPTPTRIGGKTDKRGCLSLWDEKAELRDAIREGRTLVLKSAGPDLILAWKRLPGGEIRLVEDTRFR